jgi:hypothetical protein
VTVEQSGLQWLLYTVQIFSRRNWQFIVYPAVGIDRVDEEHFRENIVKATGLEAEPLLHISPEHFFEHTARHPVYPGYIPPKRKTSQRNITPQQTSLSSDKPSLPSPPKSKKRRKNCVQPTTLLSSWSLSGRPISVRLLSDHVSEQQESYVSFSDPPGSSFPMSANRGAGNRKSKKKKRKSKRKKPNETSIKAPEPLPCVNTESEFPSLEAQTQPKL